jgi:hypothetical protein
MIPFVKWFINSIKNNHNGNDFVETLKLNRKDGIIINVNCNCLEKNFFFSNIVSFVL